MLLLSIIVPVFNNSGKDIERCINSLQNSYNIKSEYEIILIDDGSRKDCAKFLDKVAGSFSNMKVFHQNNHGVSNARNTGVKKARGNFVAFVDADDVVTSNFIPDAIWAIKNLDLDVVYGDVLYVNDMQKINIRNIDCYVINENVPYSHLTQNEKQELYYHFFDLSEKAFWRGENHISRGPVARIVRKEIAVRNPFIESLNIGEDVVWNWELIADTNRIGVVEKLWYYYIKNVLSSTQCLNRESIKKYSVMLQYFQKYAIDDRAKACLLNRTISAGCELAKGFFLTERYPGNFFAAANEFNHLFKQSPWNSVLKFTYARMVGWKCCVKLILIKAGLLLSFFKFKKIIGE